MTSLRGATEAQLRTSRSVVAACVVAGVLVVASAPAALSAPPEPWRSALVLGLCALAELPLLQTRAGRSVEAFTFAELFLVVCLVLVPAPTLVVLAAVAVLTVHLTSGLEPVRAVFATASFVIGAALAGLVVAAFTIDRTDGVGAQDLVTLAAAAVVFHLWNAVAVRGLLARAEGIAPRTALAPRAAVRSAIGAGNIALGLVVVVVACSSPRSMAFTPAALIAGYLLYRAYLGARQERDLWRQLEAATRELNRLDETEVAGVALRRSRQLLGADTVELVLARPDGSSRTYRLQPDLDRDQHPRAAADRSDEDGAITVRDGGQPALDPPSTTVRVLDDAATGSVLTSVVTALDGPRGRIGVLRLVFTGQTRLSRRERQVLSTFSHSVSATLLNAALYADMRDEAELKAYEASHDHLTGLGNRAMLSRHSRAAVATADGTTALLLLDLDHFKEINDTLGHATGDVLLQEVGRRLATLSGENQLVARLGGDEFAVLLTGLTCPEAAEPVADAVLRLLAAPVDVEGLRLSVEASLGVACHPQDASTGPELLRRADVAMYQAKTARGQWLRYSAKRDGSSVHRQALVAELRTAIELDQLVVHYQPQVDLETGLLVGAEALCRWEHPSRGLLLPGEFIDVVEHSGLVRPVTLAVLDQAVRQCVDWQHTGRPISVAVNLSARSLLDRQLPDDVAAVLARWGLPPDRLVLEITETTATSELEVVEQVLSRLCRLGVEVSVDDFGTGYSSLAFLQRTAVHELKVDRTFVAGMLTSENDLALVRATVQLAASLGARSVAEGVEQAAQAAALRDLGCDLAQGFWLSRPLPAHGVRQLLALGITAGRSPTLPAPRTVGKRALRPVPGPGPSPLRREGVESA